MFGAGVDLGVVKEWGPVGVLFGNKTQFLHAYGCNVFSPLFEFLEFLKTSPGP